MSTHDPVLRVLFVCSGNTCRSPLAAAALVEALGAEGDRVEVASAGTAAWEGQPASTSSRTLAARAGLELTAHRSRRVTPGLLRGADLVIVMERGQLSAVLALGASPEKTHVISEWPAPGDRARPVSDPFGASLEAYEECWSRIRLHVERMAPLVREALRARSA